MKKEIKIAIAVFAVVGIVFLAAIQYIKSQKDFEVYHHTAADQTMGIDGRAAVGGFGYWDVAISLSMAWDKSNKPFKNIGLVFLLLAAVYISLSHTGVIKGSIHWAFVLLAASLGSLFAAYSSLSQSNVAKVDEQRYERIKDNPDSLKALFDKPLIK